MEYDLSQLTEWSRRQSSDQPAFFNELLIGNGGTTYPLNNDGDITLISVNLDQIPADLNTVDVSGSQIIFDTPILDGVNIEVNYSRSQYTDEAILNFLCDAAIEVGVDLDINWDINYADAKIIWIPAGEAVTPNGAPYSKLNPLITRLIVLKLDELVGNDKSNASADDAIMIKDGDTTIDTSRGAGAQNKNMDRKKSAYAKALMQAIRRRFTGWVFRE